LYGLDKRQNREVLRAIGGPDRLWAKEPTADLLDGIPGRPDEVELGMTYEDIDAYVEGRDVPDPVADTIEAVWRRTRHKRTTPVTPQDMWWRALARGWHSCWSTSRTPTSSSRSSLASRMR